VSEIEGEIPGAGYTAHPTAIVDEGARIGAGTRIWHWVHVCGGARIGRGCSLGQGVFVGNDVTMGDNCRIQNNVSVYDAVHLEDDVFCGPSMVFTNVYNPRAAVNRKAEYRPTVVRRGVTLGANCTIVCGVEIGEHAFIGAGAVVNRDVPAYALMLGVPARRQGWMCRCGARLPAPGLAAALPAAPICPDCGVRYRVEAGRCTAV
jgi:UDP-2-acetamido-3-amino-2,3-dideoxy-glucuronate N-acetyltransferase